MCKDWYLATFSHLWHLKGIIFQRAVRFYLGSFPEHLQCESIFCCSIFRDATCSQHVPVSMGELGLGVTSTVYHLHIVTKRCDDSSYLHPSTPEILTHQICHSNDRDTSHVLMLPTAFLLCSCRSIQAHLPRILFLIYLRFHWICSVNFWNAIMDGKRKESFYPLLDVFSAVFTTAIRTKQMDVLAAKKQS